MKKTMLCAVAMLTAALSANAISNNTVEIVYNGSTATVTIADNISSYVTNKSEGSHVRLVQSESFAGINPTADNEDGEIIYVLSGLSDDGEFYMEGSYKATVELNGVTLTNPTGPAVNIQNGKRISVSVKKDKTSTLTDGANDDYNGSYHCKGHTKFKGKGTLNVYGKSKHAIYSKEYIEVKNCTINIKAAAKDAIHCKEYFLLESGTINITGATEDGIQVELSNDSPTGQTTSHEDENSGNFYQTGGTLSISGYGGKAIKTDGTISYKGGTRNFDTSDTEIVAGIEEIGNVLTTDDSQPLTTGQMSLLPKGIRIIRQGNTVKKVFVK